MEDPPAEVLVGAALVQPPKSSSAVTSGCVVGLDGAPQPAPMSLDVSFSGIFIVADTDEPGASVVTGAGSGVLQGSLAQGSMLTEERTFPMLVVEVEVVAAGSVAGAGLVVEEVEERLNAEVMVGSANGDVVLGAGGEVVVVTAGAAKSKRSSEADGVDFVKTGDVGFAGTLKPFALDEIEVFRDEAGLGAGLLKAMLSKSPSPPEVAEVAEAAGVVVEGGLGFARPAREAKISEVGFCGLEAGGDEGAGENDSPLNASVNPPRLLEDCD